MNILPKAAVSQHKKLNWCVFLKPDWSVSRVGLAPPIRFNGQQTGSVYQIIEPIHQQLMNDLEDIGGELGENDDIFYEYIYDKEIGSTRLADRIADLFTQAESCSYLFAPTENNVAGNLQELPTAG